MLFLPYYLDLVLSSIFQLINVHANKNRLNALYVIVRKVF